MKLVNYSTIRKVCFRGEPNSKEKKKKKERKLKSYVRTEISRDIDAHHFENSAWLKLLREIVLLLFIPASVKT